MPPRTEAVAKPRREKPVGKLARFAEAQKNNNDLLADCERLLLHEATKPQMQNGGERRHDVIHPSEIAKTDWCPRSTYLRILAAREDRLPELAAHHFQLENIFEEGHEYHRKWQARFRRMGRLQGRWFCNACFHSWFDVSPYQCVACGAGNGCIEYHEVPLRDDSIMLSGSADGEVLAADWETNPDGEDVLIEIKSIGEGTVRMELPAVFMKHQHEIENKWGGTDKVLDVRGVWKDITMPFGPHLRQGLIYLRMRAVMAELHGLPPIDRIVFIYEFKPTSMVKAFYVERNDEAVQEIWDSCLDIVYALDRGGKPPRCIEGRESCKECKVYEEQESEHDAGTTKASGEAEAESGDRARPRRPRPATAGEAEDRVPRSRRGGSDGPRGRGSDREAGAVHEVVGLLGRTASTRRGR